MGLNKFSSFPLNEKFSGFSRLFSETTEAKCFFSETKRNETKRNFFLRFRETEAKRSETVSVSLSFASKQNIFLKRNWDTLLGPYAKSS